MIQSEGALQTAPTAGVAQTAQQAPTYLCVRLESFETGLFADRMLASLTERHAYRIELPMLFPKRNIEAEVEKTGVAGVVFVMKHGFPGLKLLRCARTIERQQRAVFFYWPEEGAVERIDSQRVRHYLVVWLLALLYALLRAPRVLVRNVARLFGKYPRNAAGAFLPVEPADAFHVRAQTVLSNANPIPFADLVDVPTGARPLSGSGAYLRMDFWTNSKSGGSYGHTCHVARELAAVTEKLLCFVPLHFDLLDAHGIRQIVLPPPAGAFDDEMTILKANNLYYAILKTAFTVCRPAYLYERLSLGNYVGARLSQDLQLPYLVEYNGSEISMRRSFTNQPYKHEAHFLAAELAAFRQATVISVVSRAIKDELVGRGVDAEKILVNPNCVNPEDYRPLADQEKVELRREFGWDASHCVIGFTGTFGGWHGIDVLAKALPEICRRVPEARVLLIGDGDCKQLIDDAVAQHGLSSQVHSVGRVSQREGARLLGACDVLLSPHHRHMVDRRFFGSPTKVFEYMGMAAGIVASDLEQIGEVLSPALRLADLQRPDLVVTAERAVLCRPGDVEEFTDAVVQLARRPDIAQALGRNARQAACACYTWERHVANLWQHAQRLQQRTPAVQQVAQALAVNGHANHADKGSQAHKGNNANGSVAPNRLARIDTGDAYKDEVQKQWNSNPCGSQHGKQAQPHTLDWFLEIERHRYLEYAPWMPKVMEFADHGGAAVLEIGAGLGTDLAQFAKNGAEVTDLDLSAGHLALAQENFRLRGLHGQFIHHDAERLPFADDRFDVVYSNGVIHHTPNTQQVVREIHRVLKPGGRAIIMVYAQSSLHYWGRLVFELGLQAGHLSQVSMGELMARHVEITQGKARPLVKVYTRQGARRLFDSFQNVSILQRQFTAGDRLFLPRLLHWFPLGLAGRLMGWNLIIKATKGR